MEAENSHTACSKLRDSQAFSHWGLWTTRYLKGSAEAEATLFQKLDSIPFWSDQVAGSAGSFINRQKMEQDGVLDTQSHSAGSLFAGFMKIVYPSTQEQGNISSQRTSLEAMSPLHRVPKSTNSIRQEKIKRWEGMWDGWNKNDKIQCGQLACGYREYSLYISL